MDSWGLIAIAAASCVCIVLIALLVKTRVQYRHHRDEDHSHVYGFERKAKLLGTIPSEDHLEHKTVERDQVFELELELEADDVDLRHKHATRYRFMQEDEPERHTFVPDETIEQCISHAIVDNHREEASFVAVDDEAYVDRLIAEGEDLVRDLDQEFGHEMIEPRVADRMFNTNVLAILHAAKKAKKIDFRTMNIIAVMRSFGRAENGGRNELSKVMAARTLLGTARLTVKELEEMDQARRLFGDEFAEAAGYVDHLSRTEEIVAARRLGVTTKETVRDHGQHGESIDIEAKTKGISRSLDRPSL